jgi:hypothetical protein
LVQPDEVMAFGDDKSNKASRHRCRSGKALAGDPHVKWPKGGGFVESWMEHATKSVPQLQTRSSLLPCSPGPMHHQPCEDIPLSALR